MRQQRSKTSSQKGLARQRNTTLPAYHRLYVMLSQGIKDGTYPPGVLLPSEKSLTETYKVSRVTVRRALDHLVEEGLVTKQQGRGTIVTLGVQNQSDPQRVSGLIANLVAEGIEFTAKTIFWDLMTPSNVVYQKLNIPLGGQCYVIRRLRLLDNQPVSYASIYLPEHVGRMLKQENAASKLIIQMLDETPYPVSHTEFTLSATLVDGDGADLLELPVGNPVLRMQGLAFTKENEAIYLQDSVFHPEHYEYAVKLSRDDSSPKMVWRHN